MRQQISIYLIVAAASAALVFGQSQSSNSSTRISSADRRFMDKAAQGGMAEVKLGQLAQEKGSSPAVKDFGKRMVTDHSKANDQLKNIASQKGVNLPGAIDAKDQATYDRLSKLSGSEFDNEYMRDMVKDHQMDVNEFRHEQQTAKDTDVKSFAQQTLPTLEQHLSLAQQTTSQIGTTSRK